MGWGGRLFEAGRLLTFSAFGMGANSRLGAYSNKYGSCRIWPLTNIHPKGRAMAHNYSKIYVLKCQSLGHKTVKEVWNFGSMVVW